MERIDTVDVIKGAAVGLIAGLAGTIVMTGYQNLVNKLSESEKKSKKKKKKEPTTVKAAEMISENVFDHELTKDEKPYAGQIVHYSMGATSGLIYGIASEIAPTTTVGAGLAFGAAVWLLADDVAVPALGLTKSPTEFPLSTHAYALSSHLVYGLTTDLARKFLRNVL